VKPQQFAALAGSLLVMALILLFAGRPAPAKDQGAVKPPRTITVSGDGEVRAKPDQVTLTFGVSTWTQGASAAEAEASHLASVDRLTSAIERADVEPGAIEAQVPAVQPLTRQDYAGKTYLAGYQAVSRVIVTLDAIQKADRVIAASLANGATSLESAVYGLRNPEDARREAVNAAIANARQRAAAIASAQDNSLGDLLSVEVIEEEAPTAPSAATGGPLLFRVRVKATFQF
jgi:uncharacterized protein YggE